MQRRRFLIATGGLVTALGGCSATGGREPSTTARPPAADALVVESTNPIEGTMVNLGVGGTARNDAPTALVDCVVSAAGDVGGQRFRASARADRLAPGATWEWTVAFGPEADAKNDDTVTDVAVETRAAYAE